MTLKHR